MMLKTICLTAAIVAMIAATAPANAFDSARTVTVQTTVSYADLDISQTQGASALLERIESAAVRMCGPASDRNGAVASFRACVSDATARAVMAVNSPLVSDLSRGPAERTAVAQRN